MTLIDTHTHIYVDEFKETINEIIEQCNERNVKQLFLPNIDKDTIDDVLSLAHQFPNTCYPMMGLHPTSVKEDYLNQLTQIKKALDATSCIAVGEIGIDLYWDKTLLDIQKKAFSTQIEWAIQKKLPIVIHVREAFNEVFEIVDKYNCPDLTGIFHCFTGTIQQAEKIINYGGFKMGIGGVVTFKNSGLDKVVKEIPLEYLVLETDAPFLAPTPHRGKKNNSIYLPIIAEKIADIHQKSLIDIAKITTANALEIFKL